MNKKSGQALLLVLVMVLSNMGGVMALDTTAIVDCPCNGGDGGSGTIIIDCNCTDDRCFNVSITSPECASTWCDEVPITGTIVPCYNDDLGCADYVKVYYKKLSDYCCDCELYCEGGNPAADNGEGWSLAGVDSTLEGYCPAEWNLDWPICCEPDGCYVLRAVLYDGCDIQVGCPSEPVYVCFDKGVAVNLDLPESLSCGGVIGGCLNESCDCVDYILITAEYMGEGTCTPRCPVTDCMPTMTYIVDREDFESAMCCNYTFDVLFNNLYCGGIYEITATPYADCTDDCTYNGVQIGDEYIGYLEIIREEVCFEIECPAPLSPECGMTLCGPITFSGILNDPCNAAQKIDFYAVKTGNFTLCDGACCPACNVCDGEIITLDAEEPRELAENICPNCGAEMDPIVCGSCGGIVTGYFCPDCGYPSNEDLGDGISECICGIPEDHDNYINEKNLSDMVYLGSTSATMPDWTFTTNKFCDFDSGCYEVYAVVDDKCECYDEFRYDTVEFAYCNERNLTIELEDCVYEECWMGNDCYRVYDIQSGTVTAFGNITVPTCWIDYPDYVDLEYDFGHKVQVDRCQWYIEWDNCWKDASCTDSSVTWTYEGACLKSGTWETDWCTPEDIEDEEGRYVRIRGVAEGGCGEFESEPIGTSIYNDFDIEIIDPCEGNTIYNGKVIRGFVWVDADCCGWWCWPDTDDVCLPDHVDLYWREYGSENWLPMDSAFLNWKNSEQYIDFTDYGIDPLYPNLPNFNWWDHYAYWDVTWSSCMVNCIDNGHYEIKAVVEPCENDECGDFERAEYVMDVYVDDTSGVSISKPIDGQTVCDNFWVYGTAVGAGVSNVDFYVSEDNTSWTLYKEDIDVNVDDGRWKAPLNTCCFEDGPLYLKAVVTGPCDQSESNVMVNVNNAVEIDLTCPDCCVYYVTGDKAPIRGTLTGCLVDERVESVKVYSASLGLLGEVPAEDFRYIGDGTWEWGLCFNPCILNGASTQIYAEAEYSCGNTYTTITTGYECIQYDSNLVMVEITGPGAEPTVAGTTTIEGTAECACLDYLEFEYRKICEPTGEPMGDWTNFPGVSVIYLPTTCDCEGMEWTIDLNTCTMDGLYEIRVSAYGWPCQGAIASDTDMIDVDNNFGITLTTPAVNSGVKSGTIEVGGTVENCPVIDTIELWYVDEGVPGMITDEITCSDGLWSYMFDTTTLEDGCYCLVAYAFDEDCNNMEATQTRAICIENGGIPPVINDTNTTVDRECVKILNACYEPCNTLKVTFNDTVSINESYDPASPLDGFDIIGGSFGTGATMAESAINDHMIIITLGSSSNIITNTTEISIKINQTAILGPHGFPIVDCSAELKGISEAAESTGSIEIENLKMFSVPGKVDTAQMVADSGITSGSFVKFTDGQWELASGFEPLEGYVYIGTCEGSMPIYTVPLTATDTPPEIQLCCGWNLVGVNTYGGSLDPVLCSDFTGGYPSITKVLEFSPSGWLKLNGDSQVIPTYAYWAYSDSECNFAGQ